MKRRNVFLTSLLVTFCLIAASELSAQQTFKTTSKSVIAYLEYLPKDYASNSNKYPMLLFLHGLGERGPNTTDKALLESKIYLVKKLGPPKHINNGFQFPFIVISPQLKSNYSGWPNAYVLEVLDHVKSYLRIDEKRIHVTGLSMGGGGTWNMVQDLPYIFASAAPVCGYSNESKAINAVKDNLPVWAFHGDADGTVSMYESKRMVDAMNSLGANPRALLTIYPGVKHNAWDKAYDPTHTFHNPNMYDWFMTKTNSKRANNSIPNAGAGSDISISSGSSVSLNGSASDADGSISSYRWTKISGPNANIASAGSRATTVSGLTAGSYIFRLTVTDNGGATDSDYVKVTIGSSSSGSTTSSPPTASAGSDRLVKLPVSSYSVVGSGKDTDGSIVSYSWSKISGPSVSLSSTTSSTLSVNNPPSGVYTFRLTVKDNSGKTAYDDVKITFNYAPTAYAGGDVTKPRTSEYIIVGKGTDRDGTISSYAWTKISGPSCSVSGASTSSVKMTNMSAGTYVWRLTVKDNVGLTHYDDIKLVFQ